MLARILRFLGVSADTHVARVRAGANDAYFARWRDREGKPLKRAYLSGLELLYERAVGHFGYSLRDPLRLTPSPLELETS